MVEAQWSFWEGDAAGPGGDEIFWEGDAAGPGGDEIFWEGDDLLVISPHGKCCYMGVCTNWT